MIDDANKRKAVHKLIGNVTFVYQEADKVIYPYPDNSFDIVFSKESFLHIADKVSLIKELFRVLKPEGQLIILDWLVKSNELGPNIKKMMEADGLDLKMATIKEYQYALYAAGFNNISILSMNERYIGYTQDTINRIQTHKDLLVQRFGEESYEYSLKSWTLQKSVFEYNEAIFTKIKATKPN